MRKGGVLLLLLQHFLLFERLPVEGLVGHAQEPVFQEKAEETKGTEREAGTGRQIDAHLGRVSFLGFYLGLGLNCK